jgi:hypothetical protein
MTGGGGILRPGKLSILVSILPNVGAETLQRTFRAMAPYGRVITLMGTPGDDSEGNAYNKKPDIDVRRFAVDGVVVLGRLNGGLMSA